MVAVVSASPTGSRDEVGQQLVTLGTGRGHDRRDEQSHESEHGHEGRDDAARKKACVSVQVHPNSTRLRIGSEDPHGRFLRPGSAIQRKPGSGDASPPEVQVGFRAARIAMWRRETRGL